MGSGMRDFEYLLYIGHCTYFTSFNPESNTILWMRKLRLRDIQGNFPKATMIRL